MGVATQLGTMFDLSPETVSRLGKMSGDFGDSPDQLADAAQSFNARDQAERGPRIDTHATPMSMAPGTPAPDMSRQSFHQLASVDYNSLPSDPAPGAAPPPAQNMSLAQPQMSGGTAPYMIPGGWQPGDHHVQMKHGMAPDELEPSAVDADVSTGYNLSSADKQRGAAEEASRVEYAAAYHKAMADRQVQDQTAVIEAKRQAYVDDSMKTLQQLQTSAQKDIQDPWQAAGTGAQIAAAIAIGAGQFATMWTGRGSNAALDIINSAVNRNIDVQKASRSNARAALGDQMTLYQKNLEAFGSEKAAVLATRSMYLDNVLSLAEAQKATIKNTDAQAGIDQFLAKVYDHKQQTDTDFAKLRHTEVIESESEKYHQAQMVGGSAGTKREGNLVTTSDGTTYHLQSEKLAEGAIGKVQAAGNVQDLANAIVKLREETAALPVTEIEKRTTNLLKLKQYTSEFQTAQSKLAEQGVVTKADQERDEKVGLAGESDLSISSELNPFASGNRRATNEAYRDIAARMGKYQHEFIKAAGGEIYERYYEVDATGNKIPMGRYPGQDAKPTERLAPDGSKAIDSRVNLRTAGPPDRETTPYAPVRPGAFTAPTSNAGGNGHKRHKKK